MKLIEVKNLKKNYRHIGSKKGEESPEVQALAGVDLSIEHGDYVAIMGPSGSGKSTLMQILGLLDKKSSGDFFLDGIDVSTLDDNKLAELRSEKIGFIFQFFNLLPRTNCVDNVALPMLYANKENPAEVAKKLLFQVGLSDRLDHKPHQLSGGQQQRVAIARALANSPDIIFADEPTGNISSEQSDAILAMLEELNASGVTIILVTHEPEVAARAKRKIILKDGKIASDERMAPLKDSSKIENKRSVPEKKNNFFWKRIKENIRMALVALSLNKLRTILATLGIVIGISSVVAMIAIGVGAQSAITEQLSSLGTNLLTIYPISPKSADMSLGRNLRKFTLEDFEYLKRYTQSNAMINQVGAVVSGNAQVAYGSNNSTTRVIGTVPNYESLQNATLLAGRYFTIEENEQRQRVALIGQTVIKNVFGTERNPLGSIIKINRVDFHVIGILNSRGANAFRDSDDQIIIPLHTAMFRVIGRPYVDQLLVSVKEDKNIEATTKLLFKTLRDRRKVQEDISDDFDIRNLNEIRETLNKSTQIMSSLLAAIAAISLLVGGIGIMNVMLVSVKERTKEIGLRKALGAKKQDILLQFLIEAIVICLLGGIVGILLGYGISLATSIIFSWKTLLPISAVILAFTFSLLVGMIFGLWPAKQASNLSPIEALRYE